MTEEEKVVLVDENDHTIGEMEKMAAHRSGALHRAVSILVFNNRNELMLQQRALSKYHSPGLWTNTCCSHPHPGEPTPQAAHRRLKEEMGFECQLNKVFDFTYKAEFENGLTEHEFDHVYVGYYDRDPVLNPDEAEAFKWMSVRSILQDMRAQQEKYTVWFHLIMQKIEEKMPELVV
ncbi:MAG: isopentenyl-diphosphate Delta-isomerase [Bacteroidetes bacterium]|nr:isopentenyl-diphosphate Delta-isomerase [Bacteroidota bacterium]